ncbi:MAG TPA: hypothetical protein VNY84_08270 [Acidimicrobiales bacterium]|jgi:hypothetical protein|nr:hypothetical protein [Acidimicrobiales bacterium]
MIGFSRGERQRKYAAEVNEVSSWMTDVVAAVDEANEPIGAHAYVLTETE